LYGRFQAFACLAYTALRGGDLPLTVLGSLRPKEGDILLIYGIVVTLICLSLALWPHKRAQTVESRIAQGGDEFFEEQRSYDAYPWLRDPKRLRIFGIVGTICGLIVCALELYRT